MVVWVWDRETTITKKNTYITAFVCITVSHPTSFFGVQYEIIIDKNISRNNDNR